MTEMILFTLCAIALGLSASLNRPKSVEKEWARVQSSLNKDAQRRLKNIPHERTGVVHVMEYQPASRAME